MSPSSKSSLGSHGENQVTYYLEQQGFEIVCQNFRVRNGEVDIIACKKELLVFVEVKTRTVNHFATSQVITPLKQKRILTAAKMYLMLKQVVDKICRFDVALVQRQTSTITYIPNAFSETY